MDTLHYSTVPYLVRITTELGGTTDTCESNQSKTLALTVVSDKSTWDNILLLEGAWSPAVVVDLLHDSSQSLHTVGVLNIELTGVLNVTHPHLNCRTGKTYRPNTNIKNSTYQGRRFCETTVAV